MNVDSPGSTLRSNVEFWKQLQEDDYFEKHPCYNGLRDLGDSTCAVIEQYLPLTPAMNVVVIGCGYGRDTAHIAPRVRHVWGIDVSSTILAKAERYLGELGIANFTPVLAEDYGKAIPQGIDLVFSIVVMQHLTRDLVRDYFRTLGGKLSPSGRMLVQFVEDFLSTDEDAQLRAYEPSISWTSRQLLELAQGTNLRFIEVRTQQVTPTAMWHWGAVRRGPGGRHGRSAAAFGVNGHPRAAAVKDQAESPAAPGFDQDLHPGRPRILFVGWPESSHTHAWIDLLEGTAFNVRLFSLPSSGEPPQSWPVKTYVTSRRSRQKSTATRRKIFPPPYATIDGVAYLASEAQAKGVLGRRAEGVIKAVLRAAARSPLRKHGSTLERALADVVETWRPDVIHTLGLDPASYLYAAARKEFSLQGIGRWIVQARGGPDLALLPYDPAHRPRIEECLAACDHFICDNEQNYDNAERLGLDRRKAREPGMGVVSGSGGIDVDAMRSRWERMPSQRERVIVWPKAYETNTAKAMPVFEAILKVWDRIQPCRIEMLWMTQPEVRIWYDKLFPATLKAHCPAHQRLSRDETLDHMARARVMLAPSLSDGIPNTMLEAMALGAAPIVSPLDTIAPVVANDVNVLFARNLYPDEIADALVRMMSDDALVDRLAANNLERIRELSDRSRVRERAVAYYERVAELARAV